MPTKTIRLEKKTRSGLLYIEFRIEARNAVLRVWNLFENGVNVQKKDKENLQTPENVATYIKNQKAGYEKKGFSMAGADAPVTASATDLE